MSWRLLPQLHLVLLAVPVLIVETGAQTMLVQPYVQPGPSAALPETDVNILSWLTDQSPGNFQVSYGLTEACASTALPIRVPLNLSGDQRYFKYTCALTNLPLDSRVHYRVTLKGGLVRASSFSTRRSATNTIEFVVVGDLASGRKEQTRVAYQMWRTKPQFAVLVGDIVYSRGRVSEYLEKFWPVYNNAETPDASLGAPLMASTIFRAVIGNHDMGATNLFRYPDGLGAFYFFNASANHPGGGRIQAPLRGAPEKLRAFRAAAGMAFPSLLTYAFVDGPARFICLDLNQHFDVNDRYFRAWLMRELRHKTTPWTFVFCHQPGFHAASTHYEEQNIRLLQPVFQTHGVDIVFAGHVHNYQRTRPLKFAPYRRGDRGFVDGVFTLDRTFDGRGDTRPDGVIHIVTGGGGARLYEGSASKRSGKGDLENWADYTEKFVTDRHSFTRMKVSAREAVLSQIDDYGRVVDQIRITK